MQDFRQAWKDHANDKNITAQDMFNRCLMLTIRAETNEDRKALAFKFLKEAFSPTTNDVKLANGTRRWEAIYQCAYRAGYNVVTGDTWLLDSMSSEEFAEFKVLAKAIWSDTLNGTVPETPYCYFFVRQDISPEYQLVQNSHVAMKLGRALSPDVSEEEFANIHFVCIGVADLEELNGTKNWLESIDVNTVEFAEPDLRNEATAIATFVVKGKKRSLFKNFGLLTFND